MPFALITTLKLGFPLLTESSEEESDDEIADKDSEVSNLFPGICLISLYSVRMRPSIMLSFAYYFHQDNWDEDEDEKASEKDEHTFKMLFCSCIYSEILQIWGLFLKLIFLEYSSFTMLC